jgi:hypothetical protein
MCKIAYFQEIICVFYVSTWNHNFEVNWIEFFVVANICSLENFKSRVGICLVEKRSETTCKAEDSSLVSNQVPMDTLMLQEYKKTQW